MAYTKTADTEPNSPALTDDEVAEFLDLARSAHVRFEIVHDRLHMQMVNPVWSIWSPIRHLLDEIGTDRIEAFLRRQALAQDVVARSAEASAGRLHLAAEAMRG